MVTLESNLLARLYQHHFSGSREELIAEDIAMEIGETRESGKRAAEELTHRRYIMAPYQNREETRCWIIAPGIRYAEEQGLADPSIVQREVERRTQVTDTFAKCRAENGPTYPLHPSDVARRINCREEDVLRCVDVLLDQGVLETAAGSNSLRISTWAYDDWRDRNQSQVSRE